jgi:hypothetical protein
MVKNIDLLVDNFNTSVSYDLAGINIGFLFDVIESLTESHWISLFAAYTTNSQIHCSWSCSSMFSRLLDKYIKIGEEHTSRHLKNFREDLNKLNSSDDDIKELKKKIDLYLNTSG